MLCTSLLAALFALTAAMGAACARDAAETRDEYLARGDRDVAEERYAEAVVAYRNAVQQDPRSGEARHRLAMAYARTNAAQQALDEFVRAADLLPDNAVVQIDAGKALLLAGRFEEARARADAVLDADPANVSALIIRGGALTGMRDLEGALASVAEAVAADPERASSYVDLASLQMASGQPGEAEATFLQAIAVSPESIEAHVALAHFYRVTGRAADAQRYLELAAAIDPSSPLVNRALADLHLADGRIDDAEAPLLRLAETTSDPQSMLVLADTYVAQGRAADAQPILEDLAQRPEAFAAATVRLAGIEYDAGRLDRAYALVDRILSREPNNAQVLVLRGRWLLGEQRLDEAHEQAQAALHADPQSADAHVLLGSVQAVRRDIEAALRSFHEALRIRSVFPEAQRAVSALYLAADRPADALRFAEQAARSAPQSGEIRLLLVRALYANQQMDRARDELQRIMPAVGHAPEAHTLMGLIQRASGDRAGARRSLERALELDPAANEAFTALVYLDVGAREFDRAFRRLDERLARTPDDARLLVLAARTHATSGDSTQAEVLLRRALNADPSLMEAYGFLGQLYISQQRLALALAEYRRLARQRPDDIAAQTMMGMLLQVQGSRSEAREVYETIVGRDRRAAVASNNLAYMLVEDGGDLDRALVLAQGAVAELPDDPDINDTLGWIYYRKGLPTLARAPLERSVQRDPSNATYQYHLGFVYLALDEQAQARAALARALELDPAFELAADARAALVR